MPQVNVPGVGVLNFPDGMSQEDMAAAIQKNFPQIHDTSPTEYGDDSPLPAGGMPENSDPSGGVGVIKALGRGALRSYLSATGASPSVGPLSDTAKNVASLVHQHMPWGRGSDPGAFPDAPTGDQNEAVVQQAGLADANPTTADKVAEFAGGLAGQPASLRSLVGTSAVPSAVEGTEAVQRARLAANGVQMDAVQQGVGGRFGQALRTFANDGPMASTKAAKDAQASSLTRATLRFMGQDADTASPAVMDRGKQALKATYDSIARRMGGMQLDDQLAQDLDHLQANAASSLTPENAQVIHNKVEQLLTMMEQNGSVLTGAQYQKFQQGLSSIAKDGGKAPFIGDLRQAVTGMMQRQASPDLQRLLAQTNARYGAMKVIQKSIGAGDQVSPALLGNAVDTARNANASVFGTGPNAPFAEFALAAKNVLGKDVANSGTPSRLMAGGTIADLGLAGGAALSGNLHLAGQLLATAAAAGISQHVAKALVYTPGGQAVLRRMIQAAGSAGRGAPGAARAAALGAAGATSDQTAAQAPESQSP